MTRILSRHVVGGVLVERLRYSQGTLDAMPTLKPVFYAARPVGGGAAKIGTGPTLRAAVAKMHERMSHAA